MPLVKVKTYFAGPACAGQGGHARAAQGEPYRPLMVKQSKTDGRNVAWPHHHAAQGRRHKQHYRLVDFRRDKDGISARVERLEYDPNRSAHLALLLYVRR